LSQSGLIPQQVVDDIADGIGAGGPFPVNCTPSQP
jgi:hypothetical protein